MPDTCATLVGLGAIGCPLALLLAPVPEVVRLTLIDFDRFTAGNRALGLERADVGQYKARAVASKVRRIRRDLKVEAVVARAEHVPFGDLRGMVICCGDNRPVRSTCSEAAFRGGADALIDAGVRRDHLLVEDTHPGSAQAAYDHAVQLYQRGDLAISQQEAELGAWQFEAVRFRLGYKVSPAASRV